MRKKYIFGKKLYISILTTIIVLLTTVATTFAWVGVFANSTFQTFELSIKPSSPDDYNIKISTDGIDFKDSLTFNDVRNQILENWGGYDLEHLNENEIDYIYGTLNQDQCTTVPVVNGNSIVKLGAFKDIEGNPTSHYFKFDIYLTAEATDENVTSSDFALDVFLKDGLFSGNVKRHVLMNRYIFSNSFINTYDTLISNGLFTLPSDYRTVKAGEVIDVARVNSASAARIAFEKYPVVTKGHPELYTSSSEPLSTLIYQDDYEYPVYNLSNDVYSFGAILPDEDNLAVGYYNSTEWLFASNGIKAVSVPNEILNTRSVLGVVPDIRLTKENNKLIDSKNTNEQIGINTMMKITISFWFEGWDADCFPAINHSAVNINIGLMMNKDEI